ncbi:TAXI family TRAP transporter solute-binding subunit [Metabacillus arenae]|uniref:TAXI family TRAP transporter solute-binding subunit n=1 Tax=Metabacillus arenae TaxID=2771434 RepID=A0A926RYA2_9BACI|nr:TAXI family TRAP transporter solute-binding subunit [Metabacillus arenae]MBD1380987.1 TAXI family TRAP transporter solute-binding subunit [Metabacillus arenae]
MNKIRQKVSYLIIFLLSTMILAACSSTQSGGNGQDNAKNDKNTSSSNGPSSFTVIGGTTIGATSDIVATLGENGARIAFPDAAIRKTPGSTTEAATKVNDGLAEIGYAIPPNNYDAFHGEGVYKGQKHENLRLVLSIDDPSYITILALESSGIDTVEDLKGKRVGIGDGRTVSSNVGIEILKAVGLEEDTMKKSGGAIITGDWGEQYRMLGDGQLDAVISGIAQPATAITELSATKDVKLVSISEEVLNKVTPITKFFMTELPAKTFDWQKEDYRTLATVSQLVTSKEVSEEWIYEFTKAFWENQEEVIWPVQKHWNGKDFSQEALLGNDDIIPIHSGAEKYYKEAGILP